jgi:hypothetical protein
MQSLRNIKIDKFPNLIRTNFVPSSSQKMFIQNTDKMNYGHYVRFEALWNAFIKWLENNQAVFELLCKSDLPQEIIEVIMIKANMWFSDDIFETLQKEQCKIIGKFDTYIEDIRVNTICIKELLKHIEIQHGQTKYIDGKQVSISACYLIDDLNELYSSIIGKKFDNVGCPQYLL